MKLSLTIDLDNAAFQDGPEVSRIFTRLATRFSNGPPKPLALVVRDTNGKTVGRLVIEDAWEGATISARTLMDAQLGEEPSDG